VDWFTVEEWTAIGLSLKVGTIAMVASLPPAILVAWVLARGRFPCRWCCRRW
jgi:molybdate transport system permease protein